MVREYLPPLDARGLRVCLVASRYGKVVTERLVAGALECLAQHGCPDDEVDLCWAPGSYELPLVARHRAAGGAYDLILVLGCIIRGQTQHFDYLSAEVTRGIQLAAVETGVPIAFGVLTTDTLEQAIDRAGAHEPGAVSLQKPSETPSRRGKSPL